MHILYGRLKLKPMARKPTARYTDEEKNFIIENYENMSDKEIGRRIKRTPLAIRYYRIRELGLSRIYRPGIERFNLKMTHNIQIQGLENLISKGVFVDQAKFQLNKLKAKMPLEEAVFLGKKPKLSLKIRAKACELYKSGVHKTEISNRLGISLNSIYRALEYYNGVKSNYYVTLKSKV